MDSARLYEELSGRYTSRFENIYTLGKIMRNGSCGHDAPYYES